MIASLIMYRRPELEGAHDRLWAHIRSALDHCGIASPAQLSQYADEMTVWLDPDLVLSQTCGMPFRLMLHDRVQLVGTPDYGLEGCLSGHYRSAIVVRKDDPRSGLRAYRDGLFAYNQATSQSGYAAPYFHTQANGFWFENHLATGGHVRSAMAVAEGWADIAALDAVSWGLIQRYDQFAQGLRVLEWTEPTPALPLITSLQHNPITVFGAVSDAIQRLDSDDRDDLMLRGLVRVEKDAYLAVPNPPDTTRSGS